MAFSVSKSNVPPRVSVCCRRLSNDCRRPEWLVDPLWTPSDPCGPPDLELKKESNPFSSRDGSLFIDLAGSGRFQPFAVAGHRMERRFVRPDDALRWRCVDFRSRFSPLPSFQRVVLDFTRPFSTQHYPLAYFRGGSLHHPISMDFIHLQPFFLSK